MNKNRINIFDDPDDETINSIASNYPILTEEEKDRMFAMSERKYNINKGYEDEFSEEVRGVERCNRPIWSKYAAVAAAFLLLAGGIGGSLALGRSMSKSDPKHTTSQNASAIVTETTSDESRITTQSVSENVTTAVSENEIVTNNVNKDNIDADVIANELVNNYITMFRVCYTRDIIDHDSNIKAFYYTSQFDDNSFMEYYKVTDAVYSDPENIRKSIENTLIKDHADELYNKVYGGDLTEELDSMQIKSEEFPAYLKYNGELYVTAGIVGPNFGDTILISGEYDADANSITATWIYHSQIPDSPGNMTFNIVWDNAAGDWRIGNVTSNSQPKDPNSSTSSGDATAEDIQEINQLFNGYATVYNLFRGIGVAVDNNDKISFKINGDKQSDSIRLEYTKVKSDRFKSINDITSVMLTKLDYSCLNESHNSPSLTSDWSAYPDGHEFEMKQFNDDELNISRYIQHNGKLYLLTNTNDNDFNSIDYVKMLHDPEILNIYVDNYSDTAKVDVDGDTYKAQTGYDNGSTEPGYFVLCKNTDYQWRILYFGG